jgi:L-2-hydroxyglutarate oxidase LhgO
VVEERIGVVGGGILGLAVARRLTQVRRDAVVTVLEKESSTATHQTGHNSGVVHTGIYYTPGSLKARLCRLGVALLRRFCEEHDLPFVECGKLVAAVDSAEVTRLRELERRAHANEVPGVRWLEGGAIREVEPHVVALAALHSPTTAITDFGAVARALNDDLDEAGGSVTVGAEVKGIHPSDHSVRVGLGDDELEFDRLVVCAGIYSDRLARSAGDTREPTIVPFRGEYYRLVPERRGLVRGLVYPVPDPAYPFLGVHFTRRVGGQVDVGPNAVLALSREGYRRRDIRFGDALETFRSPGFRRLARRHWRMGMRELEGSLLKRAFAAEARRYIPELRTSDLARGGAGIRAQAVDPDGSLVDDFRINRIGRVIAVRNAPSPGATSSLAIAEHVVNIALQD